MAICESGTRLLLASGSVDTRCRMDAHGAGRPQDLSDRTGRYGDGVASDDRPGHPRGAHLGARRRVAGGAWRVHAVGAGLLGSVEVPRGRRLSPVVLATLGVVAGIGAMALGTAAVISAGRSDAPTSGDDSTGAAAPRAAPSTPIVERRVLALLAKPSTERIAFSRSGGTARARRRQRGSRGDSRSRARASGTRHALPRVDPRPGRPPVRAAQFVGTERCGVPLRSGRPRLERRSLGRAARHGTTSAVPRQSDPE